MSKPPLLRQLATHKTTVVAALPGSATWIAGGPESEKLLLGDGTAKPIVVTYGGRKTLEHGVVAMLGLDADHVALSDGVRVVRLARKAKSFKLDKTWTMPGELGWRAELAAAASGELYVTSDLRLGRLSAATTWWKAEGRTDQHVHALVVAADGAALFVGRADGTVEDRDPTTLEVRRTLSVGKYAILRLCVLDAGTLAVADDGGVTALLDVKGGGLTPIDRGGMKTSGLHRLPDGRLVVVGLSRRVGIYDGTKEVRAADFSDVLGDRYVQGSAVVDGRLLLACEEKGLFEVTLDDLPKEAPPLDLPMPAMMMRAQVEAVMQMELFGSRLERGEDVSEQLRALTATNDEGTLRTVFMIAMKQGKALPGLPELLRSPHPRVRYYAADFYGELPHLFQGRAAELVAALGDDDPTVVAAAIWSVGRVGGPIDIAMVTSLLRHADVGVRVTATTALLTLKAKDGIAALAEAIRDGAGELTSNAFVHFWPRVTPELLAPISPELSAELKAGMTVEAVAGVAAFDLAEDTPPELRHRKLEIHAPAGRPLWTALADVIARTRSPVVLENGRAQITSLERAATWWETEIGRRFEGC
jgi:HEAT repeat protein